MTNKVDMIGGGSSGVSRATITVLQLLALFTIILTIYYLYFYWGNLNAKYVILSIVLLFIMGENDEYMRKRFNEFSVLVNLPFLKVIFKIIFLVYYIYVFFKVLYI